MKEPEIFHKNLLFIQSKHLIPTLYHGYNNNSKANELPFNYHIQEVINLRRIVWCGVFGVKGMQDVLRDANGPY